MLSRHGKIFLRPYLLFLQIKSRQIIVFCVCVCNKTIIPLALVGYEIIIANSSPRASLATTISLHTRTRGVIVKSPVYPCILVEYPVMLCNIPFTHVNSSILYTMYILFTHAHPRTVDSMTICQ